MATITSVAIDKHSTFCRPSTSRSTTAAGMRYSAGIRRLSVPAPAQQELRTCGRTLGAGRRRAHHQPQSRAARIYQRLAALGAHNVAGKAVAIKLEPSEPRRRRRRHSDPDVQHHQGPSPLVLEFQIYKQLMGGLTCPGSCTRSSRATIMSFIDLLGPSLEDLFRMCRDTRTAQHIPYKQDDVHGAGTICCD
ncbi:hypothetical protein BDZ89DRAFT_1145274 [Hymenopellis radicata]|nr:hypothetical protein BDZ89DRAFT_1145274 [Hymenopellis radicata]